MALNYGTSTSLLAASPALNSLGNGSSAQTNEAVTSTTNNVVDAMARVTITVGAITPAATTIIPVYVWGSEDGSTYPGTGGTNDVVTGADGTITISTNGTNLRWLGSLAAVTASTTIKSEPMSIAAAFGGILPRRWGLVITNNTGVAFAASGHEAKYTEIYYN